MTLYEVWIRTAYEKTGQSNKKFFTLYMPLEQRIYEDLLKSREPRLKGTLKGYAEKYNMKPEYVCGFFDGIRDALTEVIDVENMDENYEFDLGVDFSLLIKKMAEYKAEHLYNLPEWDNIFTTEERLRLIEEQKKSGTYIRDEKIGRNDPCTCGSGKKYKKCCGAAS